jgi:3-methylcrotonyl-CoA carboxylase alpha subunit
MFNKILVANRGEIALRILRTARLLNVRSVAVFSDADARTPHVDFADEAVHIGPSPAAQSYLDIEKIINAAKVTGAEAIHPGYGFLSENADFAAACEQAGICFIGPSADVIRTMGSKRDAKALMQQNGVPVVPGFFGDVSAEKLAEEAEKIGFPVLIKASAGGGGRGMRLVTQADEFARNLQSAQREAMAAFTDDSVLLEKYIERPRHIEVQIFGDQHGNVIHLFERDCSVQRRFQKLIEEAPASDLTDAQRSHIHDAAVLAGNVAGYVGAGTVEFVLDSNGDVYFIEMNTRLQVEHPVTELITGQDLVEWQLKIAAGDALPPQSEISIKGHAIEVRLCAEDASREFVPSTGTITHFVVPENEIRVDHGLAAGLDISPHYDSMIAKLIIHSDNRKSAISKILMALEKTEIAGVTTNGSFLRRILRHKEFIKGAVDTHFIESHHADLIGIPDEPSDSMLFVAALYIVGNRGTQSIRAIEPDDPWNAHSSFRLNLTHRERLVLIAGDTEQSITVDHEADHYVIELASGPQVCTIEILEKSNIVAQIGASRVRAKVIEDGLRMTIFLDGEQHVLRSVDPLHAADVGDSGAGGLTAPMPGTVLEVFVTAGQEVAAGAPVMLLEAMKIEHTITAPFAGRITEIRFKPGDQVASEGLELAVMEPTDVASSAGA